MTQPSKRNNRSRLLSAVLTALAFLLPTVACSQSTLIQGGQWTGTHAPMYSGSGGNQPIVQDSGGASSPTTYFGLGELGIQSRCITAPCSGGGTGNFGSHFQIQDAATTNSTGYHYLSFDANAMGGGLLVYGAAGGASQLPLNFIINGTTYAFPFVIGGIVGPVSTVINDFACWANTVGTLLKSCSSSAGVTQVNTGTGLTGGPITSTGTISIANTGVSASTYGDSTHVGQFTVNAQGQITAATSVAISGGGGGGVNPGTAQQVTYYASTGSTVSGLATPNSGVLLSSNAGALQWGGISGNTTTVGTTSGALTNGHCVSIDASGNLVDAGGACTTGGGGGTVASGTTSQMAYYNTTGTTVSGLATANRGILNTNGSGVPSITPTPTLGVNGGTGGSIALNGSTSGTATISVAAVAGSTTFNLPVGNGTNGYVLATDGSGNTSWTAAGSGNSSRYVNAVTTCGADPTGSVDATSIINTCLSTYKTVGLPAGTYKVSGAGIQMGTTGMALVGAGSTIDLTLGSTTTIQQVSTTGNVISVGNMDDFLIQGMTLSRTVTPTSAIGNAGIGTSSGAVLSGTIRDVTAINQYNGFEIPPAYYGLIENCNGNSNYGSGFYFTNTTANLVMQMSVVNALAEYNNRFGFEVVGAGTGYGTVGPWVNVTTFANTLGGISLVGTASATVNDLRLTNPTLSTDGGHEIEFQTYGEHHQITGGMIETAGGGATGRGQATPASHAGSGIALGTNNIEVIVTGTAIRANSNDGIGTAGTNGSLTVVGAVITANNQAAGGNNGITIGAGSTNVVVTGVQSAQSPQVYGIYSNSANTIVSGSYLTGVTAGCGFASTSFGSGNIGSGCPTGSSSGVTSVVSGTNITASPSTGAVTVSVIGNPTFAGLVTANAAITTTSITATSNPTAAFKSTGSATNAFQTTGTNNIAFDASASTLTGASLASPNGVPIAWKNAAASGNINIYVDGSNQMIIGSSAVTIATNIYLEASSSVAPNSDDVTFLGGAGNRWHAIYGTTFYGGAGSAGVTCAPGSPTSSFATAGGIVTHC